MRETFDNYILNRNYDVYFSFGCAFASKKEALLYAHKKLAEQGSLVEVNFRAVPDCACDACGEMLFDWQKAPGELCGTSGSDSCYYSIAFGLVCERCAEREAELYVTKEICSGAEMIGEEMIFIYEMCP